MHVGETLDPDAFVARVDAMFAQVRNSFGRLPVWAPIDWHGNAALGEWLFENGPHSLDFTSATRTLLIRTTSGAPRDDVRTLIVRERVSAGLELELEVEVPPPTGSVEVESDGTPHAFEQWAGPEVARLAGSAGGYAVTIEARGIDPHGIRLRRVTDLEPYIAGPIERIRASRGEL